MKPHGDGRQQTAGSFKIIIIIITSRRQGRRPGTMTRTVHGGILTLHWHGVSNTWSFKHLDPVTEV
jgi:hypothetical protein